MARGGSSSSGTGVVREVHGRAARRAQPAASPSRTSPGRLGDDISEEKPILDSRLPDGSRVAAVFPPCSVGGTTLTIRKFQTRFFTAEELVRIGTLTPDVLATVRAAIVAEREHPDQRRHRHRQDDAPECARGASCPADDRVVLIEDTAELQIDRAESGALRGATGSRRICRP